MAPALGEAFTVTRCIATALPQELETVYFTVSIPAEAPVTMPDPLTVAFPSDVLQVPPGAGSVSVIVLPVQTTDAPEMVPAERNAPIFTTLLVVNVPQTFVTV